MLLQLALLLGNVTVTLPSSAEVTGTELQLSDFAAVQGDDAAEVELVSRLSLGYAPAPGHTRLFDAWRIQQDLADHAPGVAVAMKGAGACRVEPATESVPAAAIEAAARRELQRHVGNLDATVELAGSVQDQRVPAGARAPEVRSMLSTASVRPGVVAVPVRLLVDGDVYRTVWTSWKVEIWERYAVLKQPVQAGATIDASMLELRRMSASAAGLRGKARILGQAMVVGNVAARHLAAGRPLTDLDVVRPVLVNEGDTVFLEVKKGAVNARVAAVAEEDGARGDRLRLTLLGSDREMRGVVVSRDLVRIDLTPVK